MGISMGMPMGIPIGITMGVPMGMPMGMPMGLRQGLYIVCGVRVNSDTLCSKALLRKFLNYDEISRSSLDPGDVVHSRVQNSC